MILSDQKNSRLVYIQKKATEEFWDDLWKDENLRKHIVSGKNDRFVSLVTKMFIHPDKRRKIIDAGCGKGQYVYSLHHQGYSSYGIDFAPKVIDGIKKATPELNVSVGDVRDMPFPDSYFDGYWSLGVIEHFYSGYEPILEEMHRVIKPGGFLFITFPYMSPLRRIKSLFGSYRPLKATDREPEGFYQFALNHRKTRADIARHGFKPLIAVPLDGFNGLKNELNSSIVTKIFHHLQKSRNPLLIMLRHFFYFLLLPISGHSVLMVFKKTNSKKMTAKQRISYYLLSSNRRKAIDRLLFKNQRLYHGLVLDIGGRDRGKFRSPKDTVEKWIIADIEGNRNPDIILDVCDMKAIESESIDTINALELFEHVESPEKGLLECSRVLKKNGVMIASMPFLYPVHADPNDFQRWTEEKWKRELKKTGFTSWNIIPMGGFFTVLSDMLKSLNRMTGPIKYIGFIFYPLLDMIACLDKISAINKNGSQAYTTGYFILAHK